MDIYKCPKSKKFYKYKFGKKRDLQSLCAFGFVFWLLVLKNRYDIWSWDLLCVFCLFFCVLLIFMNFYELMLIINNIVNY
jgi:Ca2+/Na+ antiporter